MQNKKSSINDDEERFENNFDIENFEDYYEEYDEYDEDDEDDENYEVDDFDIVQNIHSILPYERHYSTLTTSQVIDLINEAKEKRWKVLDLSECGLRELPTAIGMLTDLEILDLGNHGMLDGKIKSSINIFTTLPPEFGKLVNLKILSLYGTKIKFLPKEFSNLNNLATINLNGADFEEFPEELCQLKNLCNIAINDSFTYLPESISDLKNLERLYMPGAQITTLPESIGELTQLKELYLARSKLSYIPSSLAKLKNLIKFELGDSIITKNIPPEIFTQTPSQIIDYILHYQKDEAKIILNESKMIIVGQGGVGKTCLLNRIINDKFVEGASTEGIDIAQWCFESEGKEIRLNTWDFGGQEIYHSTHQFFLTKRSLYIFVWDARQEEEYGRIDYWLNTIQSFANDSPIIIVINKCDETRKNIKMIDITNLCTRFPQIVDCFYVSCLDNTNIDILREQIINEAKKLPLMETMWFSSWVNVRLELEGLSKSKNIIDYQAYIEICSEHSIERDEADSLIKYLHDLGVVLHFHEDNILKNIIILSPDWGTDAVYKILDAQTNILKDRNGLLYYKDLPKIWNDRSKYPENTYPYILKLMENFQLSFVVENTNTYLVAELLDNTEKNTELIFQKETTLNFRYDYNFLPAGIMTRFIVKAHTYLIDVNGVKMCWRKGAYLQYKDAYCLVVLRDGITERYVDIKVSGKNQRNRRELLAIVRSTFEQIHLSIPKITFTEKVMCNCSTNCNYLHDFQYLIKLESNGILEERCKDSLNLVQIIMLLDGIHIKHERKFGMTEINISPIFNNSPIINTSSSASNINNITIEVKNTINELQGFVNELKDELKEIDPNCAQELNKIDSSIQKLDQAQTKEDIVKSGVLNKIKRFFEEISDSESSTGKIISGVKNGYSILQDIAEKYNSIAEWCGSPVIPKVFLKTKK